MQRAEEDRLGVSEVRNDMQRKRAMAKRRNLSVETKKMFQKRRKKQARGQGWQVDHSKSTNELTIDKRLHHSAREFQFADTI